MWEFLAGAVVMAVGVIIGHAMTRTDPNENDLVTNVYGQGNVRVLPSDEGA